MSEYFGIRILFEYLRTNTNICIRIRVTFWNRILFVFGWFSQTEYYSYSYSGNFSNRILFVFVFGWFFRTECYSYSGSFQPNIIRIRIFSNRIPLGIFLKYIFCWALILLMSQKCWRCQNLCPKSESKYIPHSRASLTVIFVSWGTE